MRLIVTIIHRFEPRASSRDHRWAGCTQCTPVHVRGYGGVPRGVYPGIYHGST